ncbi:MAG: thiamine phosphate synthase [Burkholderiales bacterium]|jgi:thiamine-phosphate pyrophosphorylase
MLKGLYAVTPELADSELLIAKVELALRGGASIVQYRNKSAPPGQRREQARMLSGLCRQFSAPLIVNDDVELAKETGAEGVHLGTSDAKIRDARNFLGANRMIGASCYNRLDLAGQACREGADYVAFGSVFETKNKVNAAAAPLSLLAQAKEKVSVPVVAIGGINLDNAKEVILAGADAVAVISALFDAADISAAARCFCRLFERRAAA